MDKEAQNFDWIQTTRADYFLMCLEEKDSECERILRQLGYHKLPKDKPPLLSDEEQSLISQEYPSYWVIEYPRAVAQAQREADIKFYERALK